MFGKGFYFFCSFVSSEVKLNIFINIEESEVIADSAQVEGVYLQTPCSVSSPHKHRLEETSREEKKSWVGNEFEMDSELDPTYKRWQPCGTARCLG